MQFAPEDGHYYMWVAVMVRATCGWPWWCVLHVGGRDGACCMWVAVMVRALAHHTRQQSHAHTLCRWPVLLQVNHCTISNWRTNSEVCDPLPASSPSTKPAPSPHHMAHVHLHSTARLQAFGARRLAWHILYGTFNTKTYLVVV